MLARELITDVIPAVKVTDTGSLVIDWMDEHKVSHLPLVKGQEYLGLICDTDILDLNITDKQLSKYKLSLLRPFVTQGQHIYEVIKMFFDMKLSVLPVLDENENYMGMIPLAALMMEFSNLSAIQEPGGIIVLEMNEHDYSLTQIAQIVEGSDGKILSCYIHSDPDTTKIEVTLKINKEDVSGILQTFERYNYIVKASFHQGNFSDEMKTRFDSFMNYINI